MLKFRSRNRGVGPWLAAAVRRDTRAVPCRRGICCALLWLSVVPCEARAQSNDPFRADAQQAARKIEGLWPAFGEKITAGDVGGAVSRLLVAFPDDKRTAAESFMLGNVLFEIDRKHSYALHRAAADADAQSADVTWEWAMEQHRAGEWAGALASYQAFAKARPGSAATYALQADCLLRLGKVDEAAAAWKTSEDAPDGSIEVMEELVCAVHREPMPHARRAELLAKGTRGRDADAAAELIALDCDWPQDWWNAGPDRAYLTHDLEAVTAALKLPADDIRARAIACAVACAQADPGDGPAIRKVLERHRLLVDAGRTLPDHAGLRWVILHAATQSGAVDIETVRKEVAPKLLELARKTSDARAWNSAVYLGPKDVADDEALKVEREGWKATGDARFAGGTLLVKLKGGKLAGDDAELAAALKQFPESGLVWRIAYDVARRENKVTKQLLAAAAKAEFTKFSSYVAPATVVNRPRAGYLREYFSNILKLARATPPK